MAVFTKSVIDLAIEKWGLSPNFYIPVEGNEIGDGRLKRSWNVINFLTKTCNQPINFVFLLLDDLLRAQEQDAIEKWLDEAINEDVQAAPKKPVSQCSTYLRIQRMSLRWKMSPR